MPRKDSPGISIALHPDQLNGVSVVVTMKGLWSLPLFERIPMAFHLLFGRKPLGMSISVTVDDARILLGRMAMRLKEVEKQEISDAQ